MSKAIITESKLTAIADAIREKAGTQDTMTVDEMATAISEMSTGGSYNVVEILPFPTATVDVTVTTPN